MRQYTYDNIIKHTTIYNHQTYDNIKSSNGFWYCKTCIKTNLNTRDVVSDNDTNDNAISKKKRKWEM